MLKVTLTSHSVTETGAHILLCCKLCYFRFTFCIKEHHDLRVHLYNIGCFLEKNYVNSRCICTILLQPRNLHPTPQSHRVYIYRGLS